MEIPPDQREAAREFVGVARQAKAAERRMVRGDRIGAVALVAAIAINAVNALQGGVVGAVSIVAVVLLAFSAGVRYVHAHDRRESYRAMVESADEVETALAFHDLDGD